ncbi:hypothetical protein B0H10DRAFT_1813420 [Mycena sp. CBHHK59/15]|nr:hypothetical protein B0H10DRAFT_1813420 [Mycena sp. CBHHK59/15]
MKTYTRTRRVHLRCVLFLSSCLLTGSAHLLHLSLVHDARCECPEEEEAYPQCSTVLSSRCYELVLIHTQANGGSDSDESPTVRSQKRPRKKRAKRRQKSRSIREIAGIRRSITEASYDFVQKRIAINNLFPAASETGDPSAADDDIEIHNRWLKSVNSALGRDRILTNKMKFGNLALNKDLVLRTWSGLLMNEDTLLGNWTYTVGVLVGIQLTLNDPRNGIG